ncbi:hypothetical protein O6H91_01G147400 [Diphasiastrum complanatum]|uniref:Uncharacterized protein n=1 Tax=Diphasiastrum complanatum TaxID=34168 RepID=A0ACC2EX16_DIPCM|nr:hypothetical protein O6H91_01G147400 [Diphasiastrum complanatum]
MAAAVWNARNLAKCWESAIGLACLVLLCSTVPILALHPLSEADKAAARQLFVLKDDGSFGSSEETYHALRSLQVLGNNNLDTSLTCGFISTSLTSSKNAKDLFYDLKAAEILQCEFAEDAVTGVVSGLLTAAKEATSILDYFYPVGALVSVKEYLSEENFEDAKATLDVALESIKALGQSDGTWRYSHKETDSSVKAAGLALEAAAGILSLTGLESKGSEINYLTSAINKLFDNIESYDDGAQYFDERSVDKVSGGGGPLAATSTVLRGVSVLASIAGSKRLKVGADKFAGLATFFLSMGILENPAEAYLQLDALGILDDNSLIVPLILSLPSSVLSRTTNDKLQVAITTVLGSGTPPLVVTIKSAVPSNEKSNSIWSHQKLQALEGGKFYSFEFLSDKTDVGKYDLNFEISSPDKLSRYAAGGPLASTVTVTGKIAISDVEVAVVDSDTGSADFITKLDSSKLLSTTISANHLQKLKISFEMTSPSHAPFNPQQVSLLKFQQ